MKPTETREPSDSPRLEKGTRKSGRTRIAMYGNMCNNLYQVAKVLRSDDRLEPHLFLDSKHRIQMLPESDDPELSGNYPDWIHVGEYISPFYTAFPFLSPLVKELNQFEYVILCEHGPIFALFLRGRKAFFVGGGDLTMFPFGVRRYINRKLPVVEKIGAVIRGFWQKSGIRSMNSIWSQPFEPFCLPQRKLGVQNLVSPSYFPIPMDLELFKPEAYIDAKHPLFEELRKIRERFDFTVFHPSRFVVDDSRLMRETGQWKNNLLLLEGFRQFVQRTDLRAGLVLIEKAGHDRDRATVLAKITELHLEENIYWLKPKDGQFPRNQLAALYSTCDCVADDFGVGWFGSIVLEGLACGRPVLNRIDEIAMRKLYPRHPIINVESVSEIANVLSMLSSDINYYNQKCSESRQWIQDYHSRQHCADSYVANVLDFIHAGTT